MAGWVLHKVHAILLSRRHMPVDLQGLASQQQAERGKSQPLSGGDDQLNEGCRWCNAACLL